MKKFKKQNLDKLQKMIEIQDHFAILKSLQYKKFGNRLTASKLISNRKPYQHIFMLSD